PTIPLALTGFATRCYGRAKSRTERTAGELPPEPVVPSPGPRRFRVPRGPRTAGSRLIPHALAVSCLVAAAIAGGAALQPVDAAQAPPLVPAKASAQPDSAGTALVAAPRPPSGLVAHDAPNDAGQAIELEWKGSPDDAAA